MATLVQQAAAAARSVSPDIKLGVCGEHVVAILIDWSLLGGRARLRVVSPSGCQSPAWLPPRQSLPTPTGLAPSSNGRTTVLVDFDIDVPADSFHTWNRRRRYRQVRDVTDIVGVISNYIPVASRRPSLYRAVPVPHGEVALVLSVNGEQGLYYCFGCGAGDAITFLREQEQLDFVGAVEFLNKASIELRYTDKSEGADRARKADFTTPSAKPLSGTTTAC
ncbi:MAG: CHC2 zinc finger domain-containing protein [Acidimicrobiales bacterium]